MANNTSICNTNVTNTSENKQAPASAIRGTAGLKVKTNLKGGWILRRPNHNQTAVTPIARSQRLEGRMAKP